MANYDKHGIPFEEACVVFGDPNALDWQDLTHSLQEKRFKRLGISWPGRVLLVISTVRRQEHGKETIRIIRARQSSRKERRAYAG